MADREAAFQGESARQRSTASSALSLREADAIRQSSRDDTKEERDDERSDREGDPGGRVLLGHAGPDPQAPGVLSTRVGYTGGDVANATYRNHGTHAEAIEIIFDPEQTSYRDLLEFFFQIHDPTTVNRQGNDFGTSYRSAIFYLDDEQRRVAEDTIADVEASGLWPGKVVTEVDAGGAVLGGRARAPGLPRALPERLHVPLPASGLGAAAPGETPSRASEQLEQLIFWQSSRQTTRSGDSIGRPRAHHRSVQITRQPATAHSLANGWARLLSSASYSVAAIV